MNAVLARPSFWSEPRDPWAWQRALRLLSEQPFVDDPWPAWEGVLRDVLSRRAVPGLYGLKQRPQPACWLGCGLLVPANEGWKLHPDAGDLVDASREEFQVQLARWIVRGSPWVRLALMHLSSGRWVLTRGSAPLRAMRALRVGHDLVLDDATLRGDLAAAPGVVPPQTPVGTLRTQALPRDLSPLRSPLYLLHALEWLDEGGAPRLPAELASSLLPDPPAVVLRRITHQEADVAGFVSLERAARRLWAAVMGTEAPPEIAAWVDRVFGAAIAGGSIEVDAWAPGQPRHGVGLYGDRDRRLARWTVHDDFDPVGTDASRRKDTRGDRP